MNKTLSTLAFAAAVAAFGSVAHAQDPAGAQVAPINYPSQQLTRDQVRSELSAAQRAGQLAPGSTEYGLVGPNARTVVSGTSRSDVRQGIAGNAVSTEQGLVGPGAVEVVASGKTRADVKAETLAARKEGLLDTGRTETGLVGPQAARVVHRANVGVAALR